MGTAFGFDSPFMNLMRKVVNFTHLNFLLVLCSLPVVTVGASISAAHYVCVKMREGDVAISKVFFDAFKSNFKRGTAIWLIILGFVAFIVFDYQLSKFLEPGMQSVVQVVLVIECIVFILASAWIFPLQARYENKVVHTIKNSFILTIAYLPTTLLMSLMCLLPIIMLLLSEYTLPLVLLFGYALPIYWNAGVYCKILDRIDDNSSVDKETENDHCE